MLAETDARAARETIEGERAAGTSSVASFVASLAPLRPGLSPGAAADVLWTLTAPDVAERLVTRRGWSWDRFQEWQAQTMADALLGPASSQA